MDEVKEESCSIESKKCCAKGIVIIVICSLVCFFLGYYCGNKSNSNINRAVGSGINRPFNPNNVPRRIPKIPRIPTNTQRMQRPPMPRVQPNISSQAQRPRVSSQSQNMINNSAAAQNTQKTATTSKKKK